MSKFKTGDKVLVRDGDSDEWSFDLFSHKRESDEYPYACLKSMYVECIPLEGNEHLLNTSNPSKESMLSHLQSHYIIVRNKAWLDVIEDRLFELGCKWVDGGSYKNSLKMELPAVIFISRQFKDGDMGLEDVDAGTLWHQPLYSIKGLDSEDNENSLFYEYEPCVMKDGIIETEHGDYDEVAVSALFKM